MAWNEGGIRTERPEALGDRGDEIGVVAPGKIGPSDRALKQHVPHDREIRFGMMEYDVPRRVARTVPDIEDQLADRDLITINEPAIGLEWLAGNAKAVSGLAKLLDPEPVILVWSLDLHAKLPRQLGRTAAMIDVAMRYEQFLDGDSMLRSRGLETIEIATGIDERAQLCSGAPKQGAILLERRDGDDHRLQRRLAFRAH